VRRRSCSFMAGSWALTLSAECYFGVISKSLGTGEGSEPGLFFSGEIGYGSFRRHW